MPRNNWPCWLLGFAVPPLLACGIGRVETDPATSQGTPTSQGADGVVAACVTGDSLLDSPVMRDLMRLLWEHSFADRAAEERRERGGFLFDSSGVAVFRADLDHPLDTPCRSYAIVPRCGEPTAAVFTHPFRPGEYLPAICHPGRAGACRYSAERFVGASALDLQALNDWRLPGYIVDKQYVYAIPRGTTPETAHALIRRYPRWDRAARCRII